MTPQATVDSPRRRAGNALVALSYTAALGLPLWTLPFSCGEDLNPLNGAVLFVSPLLLLGGFVLLVARRPRRLGYWGVAIALGLPLWYVAALSTGCSTGYGYADLGQCSGMTPDRSLCSDK